MGADPKPSPHSSGFLGWAVLLGAVSAIIGILTGIKTLTGVNILGSVTHPAASPSISPLYSEPHFTKISG
ncbi:MAG TPA: hypothetical protein VF069_14670, partial [Streptosporangiaceae bacterium]